jgi:hypothetical protein
VRHAGAIFVGASTPEVFGDYVAGPSHVLPTCGSARFASALGVEDFVRRSHLVQLTSTAAARWAAAAADLADAEQLPAHAAAARRRMAPRSGGSGWVEAPADEAEAEAVRQVPMSPPRAQADPGQALSGSPPGHGGRDGAEAPGDPRPETAPAQPAEEPPVGSPETPRADDGEEPR